MIFEPGEGIEVRSRIDSHGDDPWEWFARVTGRYATGTAHSMEQGIKQALGNLRRMKIEANSAVQSKPRV